MFSSIVELIGSSSEVLSKLSEDDLVHKLMARSPTSYCLWKLCGQMPGTWPIARLNRSPAFKYIVYLEAPRLVLDWRFDFGIAFAIYSMGIMFLSVFLMICK